MNDITSSPPPLEPDLPGTAREIGPLKTTCPACGFEDEGQFCSRCGEALNGTDRESLAGAAGSFFAVLGKFLKIKEFFHLLFTAYNPVAELRKLVARERVSLSSSLLAYFEIFFALIFLDKQILRVGKDLEYPLIAQGAAIDDDLFLTTMTVVLTGIGIALPFLLPKSLYVPLGRTKNLCANYMMALYLVLYLVIGDLVKIILWYQFRSFPMASVAGGLVLLAALILTLYVARRVLLLRWKAIIILNIIAFVMSFAVGFILGYLKLFYVA